MKKLFKLVVIIIPFFLLISCSSFNESKKEEKPSGEALETPSNITGEDFLGEDENIPKEEELLENEDLLGEDENSDITIIASDEIGYKNIVKSKVDLNGDGSKESIRLKTYDTAYFAYDTIEYDLFVDDYEINIRGSMINPVFNIVDINKEDKYLEIAVSEEGPSADYETTFFRYDGKSLKVLSKIEGYYGSFPDSESQGDMVIDGSGIIKTNTRGEILQTWYYEDTYKLSSEDEFIHIKKDLYPMITKVKLLHDLKTFKERESSEEAFTIKKGEKAIIMETDNKSWVSIKNSKNEIGWFEVHGFGIIENQEKDIYPFEYFNGLIMAD